MYTQYSYYTHSFLIVYSLFGTVFVRQSQVCTAFMQDSITVAARKYAMYTAQIKSFIPFASNSVGLIEH